MARTVLLARSALPRCPPKWARRTVRRSAARFLLLEPADTPQAFQCVRPAFTSAYDYTMAKNPNTGGTDTADATRDQLIQGLQDDIAREYKAIIQYVIFSQKLDTARYMNIADQLAEHAHQELDHAIAIARQLDYFGAYPVHEPRPVEVSDDNEEMLRADLRAEDETIRNYRTRIRQADALGEYALGEVLRGIVEQEQDHQIDLATALGVVPDEQQRGAAPLMAKKPKAR
jgi:bacterioferritin